jgi:ketol-acid reductoisomerase
MLVFASGYNIFFEFLIPPDFVDVALLAPRMIGQGVRDHYLNGEGFPSLVAVDQDASGKALERVLALAKGIGSTRMGAILSSFEEETVIDLFSEHLGGLYAIRRSFEVLSEAGYNPEAILLELYASGEEIAIAKAARDQGLWGQITLHSRTSQYGQEVTARLTPEAEERAKDRLRGIIDHIRSGAFAKDWQAEQDNGYATLNQVRAQNLKHPMIQAEEALYRILKR